MIAGICAGIAQSLAVDVTLVRLVFTLLALAGGAGSSLPRALAYNRSHTVWLFMRALVILGCRSFSTPSALRTASSPGSP